jgi:hypothetical protein
MVDAEKNWPESQGALAGMMAFRQQLGERMQLAWLTETQHQAGLGSPVRMRAWRLRFIHHAVDANSYASGDKDHEQ